MTPDRRVRAAIANWAPRMVSQGVDFSDFNRTTAGIRRWEEWLGAWSERAEAHQIFAEQASRDGHARTAGEAFVRAALCFHFAKFVWVLDPDLHRTATLRARDALRQAHLHLDPSAERVVALLGRAEVVGNLRRPSEPDRAPLVLLIPGLDSTKEEFFRLENVFLERGMATLSLDGPGQGEVGLVLPIRSDYEAAVSAILGAVEGRDDLQPGRVGALGVSLGGYYVARAAAFEPRISAFASVSGPVNFGELWEGLPGLTREAFSYYSRAADEIAAKARALELDLRAIAGRISQPALVIAGQRDELVPWESSREIAEQAADASFTLLPEGTHVCNNLAYLWRSQVADWLLAKLHA